MPLLPVALLSHNVSAATAVAGDEARVRPGFTPAIGPWDIWTRFDPDEIIRGLWLMQDNRFGLTSDGFFRLGGARSALEQSS